MTEQTEHKLDGNRTAEDVEKMSKEEVISFLRAEGFSLDSSSMPEESSYEDLPVGALKGIAKDHVQQQLDDSDVEQIAFDLENRYKKVRDVEVSDVEDRKSIRVIFEEDEQLTEMVVSKFFEIGQDFPEASLNHGRVEGGLYGYVEIFFSEEVNA